MPDLVLVPTEQEGARIAPRLQMAGRQRGWRIERCGFGPVVAAARTAQLIADHQPRRVLLIGIAGSYGDPHQLGLAHEFHHVICYGVGVGESERFTSAGDLGWPQWNDADPACRIGDAIWLMAEEHRPTSPNVLLTCCAGSSNLDEATARRRRFPEAVAEDMEGFAVAAACRLAGVHLRIVRGLSNQVGDRNHSGWRTNDALDAAADLGHEVLRQW